MTNPHILPVQPPLNAPATDEQRKELLALFGQIRAGGIRLNLVASTSGLNYKTLINKLKNLEAAPGTIDPNLRHKFTHNDHRVLMDWWTQYREKMLA
ncbi:MAG: hypothetical protein EOO61_01325 [Hymenobacter sp.]|nr:MAG: hypothetical protein EOO61_01325 [Hymenobacter sp.]